MLCNTLGNILPQTKDSSRHEFGTNKAKTVACQRLRENVCKLIGGANKLKKKILTKNLLTDEMKIKPQYDLFDREK